jgi:predicted Zn-dependent protease
MAIAETPGASVAERPSPPPALPKHRYPLPIVLAAVVTLLAAAYSFALAPGVISAAHDLRNGQSALKQGNYQTAVTDLERAHSAAPTSKDVTLALAEAEFASGDPTDAMNLLTNVKLTQSQWTDLKQYMPAKYQQYFSSTSN